MPKRIDYQRALSRLLYADVHDPITGTNTGTIATEVKDVLGSLNYSTGDANAFDRKYVIMMGTADADLTGVSRVIEGGNDLAGVLTVDPAFAATPASGDLFIISDHPPAVLAANINLVITNMWETTQWPLTLHITKNDSNDMEPSSIATDFDLTPGGAAAITDAFTVYHGKQSLSLEASTANEYAALNNQMPVTQDENLVAGIMSAVTAGDDAIFRVHDVTNNATIDSATNDEVRFAELIIPFAVPSGCEVIDLRMIQVGSDDICYWDDIQVWSQGRAVYPLPRWINREEQVMDVRYWPRGRSSPGDLAYIPDETRSRPLSWGFEYADRRVDLTGKNLPRVGQLYLWVDSPGLNRPYVVARRGLPELTTDILTSTADVDDVVFWAAKLTLAESATERATIIKDLKSKFFMRVTTRLPDRISVGG